MTEETDNVVLEQLRAIRNDVQAFRRDVTDRLDRVESRLAALEQHIGQIITQAGSDRETVHGLAQRVERIERRLELSE